MRKGNYSVEAIVLKGSYKAAKAIANRIKDGKLKVNLFKSSIHIVDKDYGTITLNISRLLKALCEPS